MNKVDMALDYVLKFLCLLAVVFVFTYLIHVVDHNWGESLENERRQNDQYYQLQLKTHEQLDRQLRYELSKVD